MTKLPKCPDWAIAAVEAVEADEPNARIALIAGILHEMELHLEGQDGCITRRQFDQGARIIQSLTPLAP